MHKLVNEVRWERMFPDQLEKQFEECPVLYFSYGMCEPHGPHNTLGLDTLKAHALACEMAQQIGGIVAPADYWHVHDLPHYCKFGTMMVGEVKRKWMTAVPPSHHFKGICYHIRIADTLGAKAAIFLTGHYGPNWKDLKTLIELIQPFVGTRLYGLPDFEANTPGFNNDGQSGGDHAGRVETSLLMALEPSCTDMTRLPHKDEPGCHFGMGATAFESDRRIGERMVADEVQFISDKVKTLLAEYEQLKPAHSFRTYADVDRFWNTEVAPRLEDFACIKSGREMAETFNVPETSIWYENWIDKGF